MTAGFVGATCAVLGVLAGLAVGWLLWVGREALADGSRYTIEDIRRADVSGGVAALNRLAESYPVGGLDPELGARIVRHIESLQGDARHG